MLNVFVLLTKIVRFLSQMFGLSQKVKADSLVLIWYQILTPEVGGSATAFGVDGGGYPMPVVYTLGFNLSF